MNVTRLSAYLFSMALLVIIGCSDLGTNDGFSPWQTYDFNGVFTIPIPSHFGGPNYAFSDAVSAGWENQDMVLYLLRGSPSARPDWAARYTDAVATPIAIDGWRATFVTWLAAYPSGQIRYGVGLYTLDPDRNNFSYHVWADCPTLANRDIAIRMLMSIRFKVQKLR